MSVAILQNKVGIGGRSKVIAEAIRALDSLDNDITIHTMSNQKEIHKFLSHYNLDDSIKSVSYPGSRVPGTIYQQLLLNWLVREALLEYDLVFNSNNSAIFLPEETNYIHYVHFPMPAVPIVDEKYEQLTYKLMGSPIRALAKICDLDLHGEVFANSNYTREYVDLVFDNSNTKILFPPAIKSKNFTKFSGEGVISVGSFHPHKRQLFQLKVAKKFPNTTFRIVGSKADGDYYTKCKRYISKNDLQNVLLYPNASTKVLENLLSESLVFLHSMINERFGIATVEGINHGCVPLVHNSGGQKEVVPWNAFRYSSQDECKQNLQNILCGRRPPESEIDSHLDQFTSDTFQSQIMQIAHNILST